MKTNFKPWWAVAGVGLCAAVFFLNQHEQTAGWGVALIVLVDLLLLGWFTVHLWHQEMEGPALLMGLTCAGCMWLLSFHLESLLG